MPPRFIGIIAAAFFVAMAGCADQNVAVKTVTVEKAASRPPAGTAASQRRHRHRDQRARATATPPTFVACDQNIRVRAETTTCGFAQNAFYEYWTSDESSDIRVYSPATKRHYETHCSVEGGVVTCRTNDRGTVKFSVAAVARYDQGQADRYATNHDVGDGSGPASPEALDGDGSTDPPPPSSDDGSDFCDTHDCIPNYPNGDGYTVQCADGTYSHSGGIQGACSHHGGVG